MSARAPLALVLAACAVAAAASGCGSSGEEGARTQLVDTAKQPPFINALDIDPETKDFLLATNTGFFRIARDGEVRRVRATVTGQGRQSALGTFLEFTVAAPGQLVGSGHPDQMTLPNFLGLIVSSDGGQTWRVVARLGDADLHKIVLAHDRLYAFDAVLGALLISHDGGRTFTEHFTPRNLIIDFEVDPTDPKRIVASSDTELYRSTNEGADWRQLDRGRGIRLAWPAADALYRALQDGTVERSADGGRTWKAAASVNGEPYKFKWVGRDELYLVLADATILHTTDGAKTWKAVFRP